MCKPHISFTMKATISQTIKILKDSRGQLLCTPEELRERLESKEYFTSSDHLATPYVIKLNDDGSITNIAVIVDSHVSQDEPPYMDDFELIE